MLVAEWIDNPWDVGVLERAEFECDVCGFTMTGDDLATLEWDEPTVVLAGRPVHECPACVVDVLTKGDRPLWDDDVKVGSLLMPHICGVTAHGCTCAADDELDRQIDYMKEDRTHD